MTRFLLLIAVLLAAFGPTSAIAAPASAEHFACLKPDAPDKLQRMFAPFWIDSAIADGFSLNAIQLGQHEARVTLGDPNGAESILLLLPPATADTRAAGDAFSYRIQGDPAGRQAAMRLVERAKASGLGPFSRCVAVIDAGREVEDELARREASHGWWGVGALLLLSVLLVVLALAAKRRKHAKLSAGILILVGCFAGVLLVEAGLRVSAERWQMPVKLKDGCYPTNPRGYFKKARLGESETGQAWCSWGGDKSWEACMAPSAAEHPRARRLLALGDSFTEAVGVFYEDTWPQVLEGLLNEDAQTRAWLAINCGKAGLNLDEILERYQEVRARHEPQIVVYGYVLNDAQVPRRRDGETLAEISFQFETPESYRRRLADDPLLGPLTDQSALARLVAERVITRVIAEHTERMYREMYADPPHPALLAELDRLGEVAAEARAGGRHFLVAIFPLFYRFEAYPFKDAHALLVRELRARGVDVLDLMPAFAGQSAKALQVHPSDYHPNERAQALAAKAIYAEIVRRGWLASQ